MMSARIVRVLLVVAIGYTVSPMSRLAEDLLAKWNPDINTVLKYILLRWLCKLKSRMYKYPASIAKVSMTSRAMPALNLSWSSIWNCCFSY